MSPGLVFAACVGLLAVMVWLAPDTPKESGCLYKLFYIHPTEKRVTAILLAVGAVLAAAASSIPDGQIAFCAGLACVAMLGAAVYCNI